MSGYIEFKLLDEKGVERNVMMNADDPNEVYVWRDTGGRGMLKTPYWWRRAISNKDNAYKIVRITSKHYYLHRVCYYAHNPEWNIYDTSSDNYIDHIDQDRGNNHISNLRIATQSQNCENRCNVKGYYKDKYGWTARVKKDGKTYRKCCKTEEEAIEAHKQLKEKYHTY